MARSTTPLVSMFLKIIGWHCLVMSEVISQSKLCVKWTACALWMISPQSSSFFPLLLGTSVYLFSFEPQKLPLCSTLWNFWLCLTCETSSVIRAGEYFFFSLINAGFVWPAQTEDMRADQMPRSGGFGGYGCPRACPQHTMEIALQWPPCLATVGRVWRSM